MSVGVHHYVCAYVQAANENWIIASEIWIIWISIPPTFPSASLHYCLAVMFYVSLLFFVSLPFLFLSRPKVASVEERKGAGEGRVVAFRPDVAYNVLHTLFYGLLAFSTMRWAHTHACVIARSCTRRYPKSYTFLSSDICIIPTQGLFKCTFPLDCLIVRTREQMLKSKCHSKNCSPSVWMVHFSLDQLYTPSTIPQGLSLLDGDTIHSMDRMSWWTWTVDN